MKEHRIRSLAKGISWRFVGTADTTLLSLFFTRNLQQSLGIGGIEFCTKILLYYVHERAWFRIRWRREAVTGQAGAVHHDDHMRSVAKGISWRVFALMDTVLIAWLITGSVKKAFHIGIAEIITKVFLYYLHERAWQKIDAGRRVRTPDAAA